MTVMKMEKRSSSFLPNPFLEKGRNTEIAWWEENKESSSTLLDVLDELWHSDF